MTKNKQLDYEKVCEELDRLSIHMLDLIKEYIDCKVLIENYVKTGSLHLAKARYIMGNKCVSSLQLPSEDCDIRAPTRVVQSKRKSGSAENLVFEISRLSLDEKNDQSGLHFRGHKSNDKEPDNDETQNKTSKSKKKSRGNKKEADEGNPEGRKKDDDSAPSKSFSMSEDPLKWFGVLVPQNLKYAQSNFSTSLDYVVQCANIQMEMNSVRSKYAELIKLKAGLSEEKKSSPS